MRAASEELKELMETQRPFTYAATITLTDGTEIELSESEMSAQGCRITWSAGSSSFPVGYAISKCLTLGFFNFGDQYIDYDFFGATVEMSASVQLSQNVETIDLDTYTITEPEEYGTTITIVGYDAMCRADIPYNSELSFPASLQSIFREVCDMIDLLPMTTNFANNSFVVDEKPEELSCRQVLGYIAQLAGGNAIVRGNGVYILPYGSYSFSTAQSLHEVISQNISTDDVVITGVTLRSEDDEVSAGNSGYMLSFENPLTKGNEATAANLLASLYVGLTFRPFEQKTMSYPLAEFGDTCTVYRGGEPHGSYITDIDFDFRGTTTLKCSADSPVRNAGKSQQGSATIRELKKLIRQEKTTREIAEADLAQRIASTKGMYQTIEQTQEGSIYYLHDKPELSNSQIIWKMTSEAMAVSTNGGQTWNAGLTVDGVLLAKILSTEGVDAEWINTGSFVVKDQGGDTVFLADVDTGRVLISGDKVFIGDVSIADMISDMTGALTVSLSNEMQAIPVAHDGSYDTFPQISTTVQVFASGQDVTDSCVITYSEFNVTGNYTQHVYTPFSLSADTGYVTFSARYSTSGQTLTASRKFSLYKSYAGETGADGKARLYFLDSNADVIKQGADGSFTPPEIVFTAHYRDSNEELRHPYSGLFKVEVTEDGSTWTVVEQPGTNKQSTTYTPTDGIQAVRCYLYSTAEFDEDIYGLGTGDEATILTDSDGVWLEARREGTIVEGGNLLDIQTSPVVRDVSSLTQEQVFNILTNNGETQGVYLLNGKLYINAQYIATGTLASADGKTSWNLDTGELLLNPAAKVGTAAGGETLSSMQGRITTNNQKLSVIYTAVNGAGYTGTDAAKWASVMSDITASAEGVETITAAFDESGEQDWDAVFGKISKASTEVNNLLTARNSKGWNSWATAFTDIKTSTNNISTLVAEVNSKGLGTLTQFVSRIADARTKINDAYNALPDGYTGDWDGFFSYVKQGAGRMDWLAAAYRETYDQSPTQARWETLFDHLNFAYDKMSILMAQVDAKGLTDLPTVMQNIKNAQALVSQATTSASSAGYSGDSKFQNYFNHLSATAKGTENIIAAYNAKYGEPTAGEEQAAYELMFASIQQSATRFERMMAGYRNAYNHAPSSGEQWAADVFSVVKQTADNLTVWVKSSEVPAKVKNAIDNNTSIQQSIVSVSATGIRVDTTGPLVWNATNSSLTKAGKLTATGADITGKITASSGEIGGFVIGSYAIQSGTLASTDEGAVALTNANFTRAINGTSVAGLRLAIGGNFGVTKDGSLYASSGKIGGFTIGSTTLQSGTLASTDDGAVALTNSNFTRAINGTNRSYLRLAIGGNFAVSRAGTVYASDLIATGGTVGGFTISDTSIRSGGLTSTAAGSIGLSTETFTRTINGTSRANLKLAIGGNFGVDQNGKLYAGGVDLSGSMTSTSSDRKTQLTSASLYFGDTTTATSYGTILGNPYWVNSSTGDLIYPSEEPEGYSYELKNCMEYNATTAYAFRLGTGVYFTLHKNRCYIGSTNTYAKTIRASQIILSGEKSRSAGTDDYGKRLLYCYEMPSPMFGDIGEGVIGDDGKCYVTIDPTFSETIQTTQYQVFLQMYGEGTAYVAERKPGYFIVCGTPGLSFGWEMKAKQKGFENRRLDSDNGDTDIDSLDYGVAAKQHIDSVLAERSIA